MCSEAFVTTPAPSTADKRAFTRAPQNATAFMHPLHAPNPATFRVDLLDLSENGAGIRTVLPATRGAYVVLSIAHPSAQRLFLCRISHCTPLANGRYHIGLAIQDQREGNLNTTRI